MCIAHTHTICCAHFNPMEYNSEIVSNGRDLTFCHFYLFNHCVFVWNTTKAATKAMEKIHEREKNKQQINKRKCKGAATSVRV